MRKNIIGMIVVGLALVSFSGCFKHVISYGEGGSKVKRDKSEPFFILGLANQADIDVQTICKSPHATVKMERTFLDGFLTVLTFGIYTPSTVTVMCGDGK